MKFKNMIYPVKSKVLFACLFSLLFHIGYGATKDQIPAQRTGLSKSNYTVYHPSLLTDTLPRLKDKKEKEHHWEVLFDGTNTDKWRGLNSDSFPSEAWAIERNMLFVNNHTKSQDIITREKYRSFELVFDFKLTYAANSGIKYFVNRIKNNRTGNIGWNGPEYQIIDDYNNPAVKDHQHDIGSTAAFYLIYAPQNKHLLPAGQWNHGKIIAEGTHVEHWLNGVKVVSCERGTNDYRKRISTTKFKDYDNYGEASSGHIMLTDHDGDKVYYRNIKIKRLD